VTSRIGGHKSIVRTVSIKLIETYIMQQQQHGFNSASAYSPYGAGVGSIGG
jgi:hypothetical protein